MPQSPSSQDRIELAPLQKLSDNDDTVPPDSVLERLWSGADRA